MKVKMRTPTYWDSQRLKPGNTADVDDTTAARWETAGIAERAPTKAKAPKNTDKE